MTFPKYIKSLDNNLFVVLFEFIGILDFWYILFHFQINIKWDEDNMTSSNIELEIYLFIDKWFYKAKLGWK